AALAVQKQAFDAFDAVVNHTLERNMDLAEQLIRSAPPGFASSAIFEERIAIARAQTLLARLINKNTAPLPAPALTLDTNQVALLARLPVSMLTAAAAQMDNALKSDLCDAITQHACATHTYPTALSFLETVQPTHVAKTCRILVHRSQAEHFAQLYEFKNAS